MRGSCSKRGKVERYQTKADLGEAKAELKTDIVKLDAKLDIKIEEVRTELAKQYNRMILWMIGAIPAIAGAVNRGL